MKKRIQKHITDLLKDESGQGTTEYILILVGVVALAIVFKDRIVQIIGQKTTDLGTSISTFNPTP